MINIREHKQGKTTRMNFSKNRSTLPLPNLVEIQTASFKWFLEEGLAEVLRDVSPITDFSGNLSIEFVSYSFDQKPKYTVEECKERDVNYAAPLKVNVRLTNKQTGEVKQTDIFMGEFPIMTETGTFVINGAERVIVSQIIRSPGMYYASEIDKTGKRMYTSTVIPYRGAWLEYETDINNVVWVRIDKNRKVPITMLIRALGVVPTEETDEKGKVADYRSTIETRDDVYAIFGNEEMLAATFDKDECEELASRNHTSAGIEALKEIYKRLRPGEPPLVESAYTLLNNYFFDPRRYDIQPVGRFKFDKKLNIADRIKETYAVLDVISPITGELLCERNSYITPEKALEIQNAGVNRVAISKEVITEPLIEENIQIGESGIPDRYIDAGWKFYEKLVAIKSNCPNVVISYDHSPVSKVISDNIREHILKGYSIVGSTKAYKANEMVTVFSNNTIEPEYIIGTDLQDLGIKEKVKTDVLLALMEEVGGDIDALKEAVKLNMAKLRPQHVTRDDIFASINYLFNLTHEVGKYDDIDHLGNRRIRSVGEQLQNQMRIGFSRMDKIIKERMTTQDNEKLTPQALINIRPIVTVIREFFGSSQLSQFMDQNNPLAELTHKRRLSALGPGGLSRDRASFDVRDVHYTHYGRMCPIETPEGPNIGLISYLTTYARISEYGFIMAPYRKVKHVEENGVVRHYVTDEVEYMTADTEDNYIVAQANEALDENNCFIRSRVTARDKTEIVEVDVANVDYMDVAPKMVVSVATACIPFLENDDNSRALMGSNMQKQAVPLMVTDSPIVGTGMEYNAAVDSGVVITSKVAGVVDYVDADKVVIICEDGHKETYNLIKFKRTNQGTCFNQRPIVERGERIEVGQVIADGPATDMGELSLGKNALIGFMTWEGYNYEDAVLLNEKLVRDDVYTSLHIEEYTHDARDTKLGPEEITREIPNVGEDALKDLNAEGIVKKGTEVRAGDILVGKITPKGETELTSEERLLRAIFGEKAREVRDTSLRVPHGEAGIVVDVKVFSHENGDELPAGVNKSVRIYLAQKRKISVGDKMAGRHGNKGVVSRILPPEDMPFLPDGTPLDIVLNPLGVPSRMNIGQVLEVHLGIAARKLGWKIMTPVFDGANERDIVECLEAAGLYREIRAGENVMGKELISVYVDENGEKKIDRLTEEQKADKEYLDQLLAENKLRVVDGKTTLYDGRTGEPFDNPVTVGVMYYLKLHHLVDDKIHARSNGPYSLVTQQPLGGKAQFGGQRFGEMEVWALEAYGAAYTLQEILTVKSDDINGRRKAYEAIIKGQNIPTPGVPESFKVLVKELQSLALDIRVLDEDGKEIELNTLCAEEETPVYSTREFNPKAEDDDFEEYIETDDVSDNFIIEDEEGNAIEDDDMFGDVYEDEFSGDYADED